MPRESIEMKFQPEKFRESLSHDFPECIVSNSPKGLPAKFKLETSLGPAGCTALHVIGKISYSRLVHESERLEQIRDLNVTPKIVEQVHIATLHVEQHEDGTVTLRQLDVHTPRNDAPGFVIRTATDYFRARDVAASIRYALEKQVQAK